MATRAAVEFKVLGPIAVRRDGREIALGGSRQQALLALLLVRRGEAVPAERLIDNLWDGAPPPAAAKTLQVYVSRLRRAVGDELLVRHGTGYAIDLTRATLDAERFERGLDEGRAALAGGDPRRAAPVLDEALALWRGSALDGFERADWSRPERDRLEALRLLALEERTEARLQLGEAARLVPDLEALVAEHPLQERFRAQLMLALYRTGRQADALEVYREGRRRHVDELGIEPGPELRELERQILAQDPELGPARRERPILGRRGARRLAAVCALLVGGLAVTGAALRPDRPPEAAATAVAALDAQTGAVRAQAPLSSPATAIAAGPGAVWALSGDTGTITQLDPRSGQTIATFAAGYGAVDLAYGGGRLWVLANGERAGATVTEIEPQSRALLRTLRVPRGPAGAPTFYGHLPAAHLLAWSAGRLWGIGPSGGLFRLEPARRRVRAAAPGVLGQGLAAAGDALWVRRAQPGPTTFTRVDARTGRTGKSLRTPAIGLNAPSSFAAGDGVLWVPDTYAGVLYRVTPGNPPVFRAVQVGVGVTSVAFGPGGAWAGDDVHDTLTRIDAATGRISRVVRVPAPQALASTPSGVWVGSGPAPAVTLPRSNCGPLVASGHDSARFLIASDLALQGSASSVNLAMARAVEDTLRRRRFRAGAYPVGYQSCDDSTPQAGTFDFGKCVANAKLFARTPRVVGVIGTYDSPCTGAELPLLEQAPGGAVPIVSPQNTYQLLTRRSPAAPADALQQFYPAGIRNFMRVTPTDTHEMAADALLARELGVRRVLVVADDGTGGSAIHTPEFVTAARRLGLRTHVVTWRIERRPPAVVVAAARRFRAGAVFISAGYPPYLGRLVGALGAALGPRVPIIGTDYFQAGRGIWRTAGGARGSRVYVSVIGVPNARLPAAGRRFLARFGPRTPSFGAAYAAQATDVLLDAIARSDGTRPSVLRELRATDIRDGILGRIRFDRYGDVLDAPITILRLQRGARAAADPMFTHTVVDRVITPPPSLVP